MFKYHIFSDNLVNAGIIANKLEISDFQYSFTVFEHNDEKLIKFTITTDGVNACEDSCILEDIRLQFGL